MDQTQRESPYDVCSLIIDDPFLFQLLRWTVEHGQFEGIINDGDLTVSSKWPPISTAHGGLCPLLLT